MSRKRVAAALALLAAAAVATACGEAGIELKPDATASIQNGAEVFNQRCGGCHTLTAAGTEGSAVRINDRERTDGPNFNQRKETTAQVLYAIANGGFSGAIMPQNIVVGQQARDVAAFVAQYSGVDAKNPPSPGSPPPGF
jgi:mono/diheme cytochrome c family protein